MEDRAALLKAGYCHLAAALPRMQAAEVGQCPTLNVASANVLRDRETLLQAEPCILKAPVLEVDVS